MFTHNAIRAGRRRCILRCSALPLVPQRSQGPRQVDSQTGGNKITDTPAWEVPEGEKGEGRERKEGERLGKEVSGA